MKQFVKARRDQIELFYLPPYCPEVNPDELAWTQVKDKVGKALAKTRDEMRLAVFRALAQLQKRPVRCGFLHRN